MLNVSKDVIFLSEEDAIENAIRCSDDMDVYLAKRSLKSFRLLLEEIEYVLKFWTGRTNVGVSKNSKLENAYQEFFSKLLDMLILFRNGKSRFYERFVAKKYLYQGTVYRYLGSHYESLTEPLSVRYNDIFVSWNKDKRNSYILSKLMGKKVLLTCKIDGSNYGIDLDEMGLSVGNEREVVFPTIKETIIDEEVID